MKDEQIIALYWDRDEHAIRETNIKYGAYCFSVAHRILNSREDSEECVSDTWLRAWNAMPPKRPDRLRLFLARITRNLSFDRYRLLTADKRGRGEIAVVLDELAECLPAPTDVAAELEYFMKKKGAQCPAFETIAVSGKKSSMPHGVPESIVLTENSFLTMDFGAKYNGYCSDMTRTVVLGKADDEMKRVYNTVLEAQLAGIAAAHGGALGKDVDKAARDIIDNAGYKGLFGHSLGHSLGIEIHENPRFAPKFDKECPVQSIITVEPGIYIPGKYGVRIEDMVLLGKDGCRDLTHSPKQLIEI